MKRIAVYAHFDESPNVALHVLFYLRELQSLGFEICFVSNSPVSAESRVGLSGLCRKIIQRENVGLDFSMWKTGLAEYDLANVTELLLTNSSIIGPLRALAPLWEDSSVNQCDFWGLTDSAELMTHLQSYFLVFRKPVIASEAFGQFWDSVIPYVDKYQIIRSYELGLTRWLEEQGFRWKAVYHDQDIFDIFNQSQGKVSRFKEKVRKRLIRKFCRDAVPGSWRALLARVLYSERYDGLKNTTLFFPDVLMRRGMPFIKMSLIRAGNEYVSPRAAFRLIEGTTLPSESVNELRMKYLPV